MKLFKNKKNISEIDWERGAASALTGFFIILMAFVIYMVCMNQIVQFTERAKIQVTLDSLANGIASSSVIVSAQNSSYAGEVLDTDDEIENVDMSARRANYFDYSKAKDYISRYLELAQKYNKSITYVRYINDSKKDKGEWACRFALSSKYTDTEILCEGSYDLAKSYITGTADSKIRGIAFGSVSSPHNTVKVESSVKNIDAAKDSISYPDDISKPCMSVAVNLSGGYSASAYTTTTEQFKINMRNRYLKNSSYNKSACYAADVLRTYLTNASYKDMVGGPSGKLSDYLDKNSGLFIKLKTCTDNSYNKIEDLNKYLSRGMPVIIRVDNVSIAQLQTPGNVTYSDQYMLVMPTSDNASLGNGSKISVSYVYNGNVGYEANLNQSIYAISEELLLYSDVWVLDTLKIEK